ncbi:hypothetical protein B0H12DRAFT_1235155 [Mycena haematopus]|nr:hypothetical protein B0H12DRAFT_1235155 [Mycena haematopus]
MDIKTPGGSLCEGIKGKHGRSRFMDGHAPTRHGQPIPYYKAPHNHVQILVLPLPLDMSQYSSTLLADRRSLPYFPEDRAYYSTSGRVAQWSSEPSRTPHYIPTPASFVNPWNAVNFTCQPEYNSRSALTHYPPSYHRPAPSPPYPDSSRRTSSSLLDAISVYTPSLVRPASETPPVSDASTPYADANTTSSGSSVSPPPPATVKEEQPDDDSDCFIIDQAFSTLPQMLAPPTEVPLRATQACAHMRRMMGVFRLNPFAMHARGGRGVLAPWAGGEAGPLDEEPLIFEFQLNLPADEDEMKLEERELGALDARRFSLDAPGLRAFLTGLRAWRVPHLEPPAAAPRARVELGAGVPLVVDLRPCLDVPARPASTPVSLHLSLVNFRN